MVKVALDLLPPPRRRHLSEFGLPPWFESSNTPLSCPIRSKRKTLRSYIYIYVYIIFSEDSRTCMYIMRATPTDIHRYNPTHTALYTFLHKIIDNIHY